MQGPHIIARSISELQIPDKFGNEWQYHSRSHRQSNITCWAIMFDLIQHCPLFRQHIEARKIGFGINHELRDFRTQRKKDLDLVVCTPSPGGAALEESGKRKPVRNFVELADAFEVVLSSN